MHYADRTILVTVPFPDTLELTADVLNEHMPSPAAKGGGVKTIYKEIDQELIALVKSMKLGETLMIPKPSVKLGNYAEAQFLIEYDASQPLHRARLTLARRPGPDFGSWSVRFEFSASKAGAAGLVKLNAAFDEALPFSFEKMLPAFRVSRVDPAIDLIGAYPLDLIAHISVTGKRLVYVGEGGHPESLYLYERKKPLTKPPSSLSYNTRGTLRLKLYERRDYMKQLKLVPPYGDCPITRVEVERRWRKKEQRPFLSDLADINNPLIDRRVAYAAGLCSQATNKKAWIAFCLAAFGGGVGTAQRRWQSVAQGLSYQQLYVHCEGDLINPSRWEGWSKGLQSTGLDAWIKSATGQP